MLVDLRDQYTLFLDVNRIFLPVTVDVSDYYHLQVEEQLIPIFHDNRMRQQVNI